MLRVAVEQPASIWGVSAIEPQVGNTNNGVESDDGSWRDRVDHPSFRELVVGLLVLFNCDSDTITPRLVAAVDIAIACTAAAPGRASPNTPPRYCPTHAISVDERRLVETDGTVRRSNLPPYCYVRAKNQRRHRRERPSLLAQMSAASTPPSRIDQIRSNLCVNRRARSFH
jgi:hypothetical protein